MVWLLVKWLIWKKSEVCVQPWCNPLWLTGLKAPTNVDHWSLSSLAIDPCSHLPLVFVMCFWCLCLLATSLSSLVTGICYLPLVFIFHWPPVCPCWPLVLVLVGCSSFLFCSCVSFRLYVPFNCISLHKFFRQLFLTLFFQSDFYLTGPFNCLFLYEMSPSPLI